MIARTVYTLLLAFVSPILLYGLFRKRPNKPEIGHRWKEHFGHTPTLPIIKDRPIEERPIWIHAVSVGEVLAVTPFIKTLHKQKPNTPILLTTTTATGAEQAEKMSDIAIHRYMPVDFPFALRRFLQTIKPAQMIIVETELWPNTLHTVAQAGIPISVLNARLSDKSRRGYQKIRPFFNAMLQNVTHILCQHQEDADNFIKLGVAANKLQVTGSIKFDIQISQETIEAGNLLRAQLGDHRPVWIAASTHQGEDEKVLSAHKKILEKHPDAALILVPRHPERFDAVTQLVSNEKFLFTRRTIAGTDLSSVQVYVGDTMGEMFTLIQASDVCFMGGSLLGDKVGGHNLLEPAALGKPTIIGPSYFNFTEITTALSKLDAVKITADTSSIIENLLTYFGSKDKIRQAGLNAMAFVKQNRGAIAHSLKVITEKMTKS